MSEDPQDLVDAWNTVKRIEWELLELSNALIAAKAPVSPQTYLTMGFLMASASKLREMLGRDVDDYRARHRTQGGA